MDPEQHFYYTDKNGNTSGDYPTAKARQNKWS